MKNYFKEKLHSVCKLTKGYHHVKEERISFFELCCVFAILFDSCTDLLIQIFLLISYISSFLFGFEKPKIYPMINSSNRSDWLL